MRLEVAIRRKLIYLFTFFSFLVVVAVYVFYQRIQAAQKQRILAETQSVFSKLFAESLKTNDIPEMSIMLKRINSGDARFFLYDYTSSQLILSDFDLIDEFKNIGAANRKCTSDAKHLAIQGRLYDVYCIPLKLAGDLREISLFEVSPTSNILGIATLIFSIILLLVLVTIVWFVLSDFLRRSIFNPLQALEAEIVHQFATLLPNQMTSVKSNFELADEFERIRLTFNGLFKRAKNALEMELKIVESDAKMAVARQVAHDIRSPLTALNMLSEFFGELSEDKRLLALHATRRINDIANGLLKVSKPPVREGQGSDASSSQNESGARDPVMLVALVDQIVSEKRAQYRQFTSIEIFAKFERGYGLFCDVDPSDFSRSISNLISNSVEAIHGSGSVKIEIFESEAMVVLVVTDNGKGIPPEILNRLGERGISHGKTGEESGHGLGLSFAIETVKNFGGFVSIDSKVGVGTSITLKLPVANPPKWFLSSLKLKSGALVLTVDDDHSVHQIWAQRFEELKPAGLTIRHIKLYSVDSFREFARNHLADIDTILIDFEFLGQRHNGIEALRNIVGPDMYLVTSHYEDPSVQKSAQEIGLKMIPKMLVAHIPMIFPKKSRIGLESNETQKLASLESV